VVHDNDTTVARGRQVSPRGIVAGRAGLRRRKPAIPATARPTVETANPIRPN